MPSLDTVKFGDAKALQPGLVWVVLKLTGTGASAPTAAAGSDNDNRIVSTTLTRNGAGDYTIPLSIHGRVLLGAFPTVTGTGTNGVVTASAVLSTNSLRIKLMDPDTANAADIANGDVCHLLLLFKNTGA